MAIGVEMEEEYLSCGWLESGIAFSPRGIHICCVCHHGDKGWIPIADFRGGDLPIEDIKTTRKLQIEAVNNGAETDCSGCNLLARRSWSKREHLINEINLSHFTTCNLKCSYCYLMLPKIRTHWWNDPDEIAAGMKPLDLMPVFEAMLRDRLLAPNTVVNWGGGEPTIMPEFKDLLPYLTSKGVFSYVNTNGTVYSKVLEEGLLSSKVSMVCSVDAGSAQTYKLLKESDSYEDVWRNLKAYAQTGHNVQVKYIFIKENLAKEEIREFVTRTHESGIRHMILDVDAFEPDITDDIRQAILFAKEVAEERQITVDVAGCGVAAYPEKEIEEGATPEKLFPLMKRVIGSFYRKYITSDN